MWGIMDSEQLQMAATLRASSNQHVLPKYYQLKRELINRIDREDYREDELIPSERELTEEFGMSRITVRRAIDELVNEGYLYRIQGKGTYVRSAKYGQDLFSISSCTQDVLRLGMTPSRRVISARITTADKKHSRSLNIPDGSRLYRLERTFYADEEPINHTESYLPYNIVPGIEQFDFSKESLYEVLEKHYKIQLTKATRTIEAILAEDKIARYLGVHDGTPILLLTCVTYGEVNGREQPVEAFKCCYRSDKFKFYVQVSR